MEKAIKKQDAVITGYRCHAHLISRYRSLCNIFRLLGKNDGISSGKGGSCMFDPKNNFGAGMEL